MNSSAQTKPFRLLSYNIQAGLNTRHYGHYVTGAWRHAVPSRGRHLNLMAIADLMKDYDFVAIQEADAGSIRTRYVNLIEMLAQRAGFEHYGLTVTRNLGPLAQICLGYLSKTPAKRVITHQLPSRVPGRGALEVDLTTPSLGDLSIMITHLSLGSDSRARQIQYIAKQLGNSKVVVVGDFNCTPETLRSHPALASAGIRPLPQTPATYPSWQPRQSLDQVLLSPDLKGVSAQALPALMSDHLPLSVDLIPAAAQ